MNTIELIKHTQILACRLLTSRGDDLEELRSVGSDLLRQLERDMSVHAVEQPRAAYPGTRAWYLLDEMFRHETLLGSLQAPTSSDRRPKSAL